ncbi:MAG: hypothetical protein R2867_04640 [Caldilineaceae bacterium]
MHDVSAPRRCRHRAGLVTLISRRGETHWTPSGTFAVDGDGTDATGHHLPHCLND